MIALYIISITIFAGYILAILIKFGVPCSISESATLWNKTWGKYVFWGCFIAFIAPMMIFWLQISAGMWYQFLAFLSCGALCFTAITGDYRSEKMAWTVHTYGTIACGICAQLWMWFTFSYSWIASIFAFLYAYGLGSKIKGTKRDLDFDKIFRNENSVVFFMEVSLFLMAYVSILAYYLNGMV